MITGPTEGIGRATAFALAERGARLHLLCRNPTKAEALRAELLSKYADIDVALYLADLGDFDQVRSAACAFVERNEPLDVLINNAGVFTTRRILLDDGQEQMFAVNHLGHFLLTTLLLDSLKRAEQGRVVVVASDAYRFCRGIRFDDLQWNKGFSAFPTYGHSKLANILFTRELAERLRGTASPSTPFTRVASAASSVLKIPGMPVASWRWSSRSCGPRRKAPRRVCTWRPRTR